MLQLEIELFSFWYILSAIFLFFLHRDGLISVDDAVEAVSGYTDDLWKLGDLIYTEERMKSFVDVIGDEVVSLVRNTIGEVKYPN